MDYSWTILLSPYYNKDASVPLCPSAYRLPVLGQGALTGQFGNGLGGTADSAWSHVSSPSAWYMGNTVTNYGSYAFNGWLYRLTGILSPPFFQSISAIKQPSKTPVFGDAISHDALVNPTDGSSGNLYSTLVYQIGNMQSFIIARHGGRPAKSAPRQVNTSHRLPGSINIALFDGHVEKVPLDNLWTYYWSATWQVPNPRPGLVGP
jgi:prepilin-type processing-associated H-X9-DG protein